MGIMKRVRNTGINGTTSPSSPRNYVPLVPEVIYFLKNVPFSPPTARFAL